MPQFILSSALGSGMDSDDEVCIPITTRHYKWSCNISGSVAEFPSTVIDMLDCGAHVVLIDLSLVKSLCLCCFCLPKPISVTAALQEGGVKAKELYEYVKLSVSSTNNAWTLNTFIAVLTPNLCVPLLLGSLFLELNHIVMDFKAGTTIDKLCGYDLLNPPKIK